MCQPRLLFLYFRVHQNSPIDYWAVLSALGGQ